MLLTNHIVCASHLTSLSFFRRNWITITPTQVCHVNEINEYISVQWLAQSAFSIIFCCHIVLLTISQRNHGASCYTFKTARVFCLASIPLLHSLLLFQDPASFSLLLYHLLQLLQEGLFLSCAITNSYTDFTNHLRYTETTSRLLCFLSWNTSSLRASIVIYLSVFPASYTLSSGEHLTREKHNTVSSQFSLAPLASLDHTLLGV